MTKSGCVVAPQTGHFHWRGVYKGIVMFLGPNEELLFAREREASADKGTTRKRNRTGYENVSMPIGGFLGGYNDDLLMKPEQDEAPVSPQLSGDLPECPKDSTV